MFKGLSLDQAPPIWVPFSFYLVAPLFALASVFVFIFFPSELGVFAFSRWSSVSLAATHLYFLGFVITIIFGTMFQMLPVLAGSIIHRVQVKATVLLLVHCVGVLALVYGFISGDWNKVFIFLVIFFLNCFFAIAIFVHAFLKAEAAYETVSLMKGSFLSFGIVLILAFFMLSFYFGHSWLPFFRPALTDLHASWAWIGFLGFLILAVSFQVIPMFFVTSPYPLWFRKNAVNGGIGLLFLKSLSMFLASQYIELSFYIDFLIKFLFSIFAGIFIFQTWKVLLKRKRAIPDTVMLFWKTAMFSLLLDLLVWLAKDFFPSHSAQLEMLLGALFIFFIATVIFAMLYKIAPFLVWFHLQGLYMNRIMSEVKICMPTMKDILPDFNIRMQIGFHCLFFVSFLGFLFNPLFFKWIFWGSAVLNFTCIELALLRAVIAYKKNIKLLA